MSAPTVVATHIWPLATKPVPVSELVLDWGGAVGDRHHGETMPAGSRQSAVFAKGTVIRNHRQLSIVDAAELAIAAKAMGIDRIEPGLIADNIYTDGIPTLTSLPSMTRLVFEGGAVIMLGGENLPCSIAGAMIGEVHGTAPMAFVKAAMGLRGVTGWVEFPGAIRPGERITIVTP